MVNVVLKDVLINIFVRIHGWAGDLVLLTQHVMYCIDNTTNNTGECFGYTIYQRQTNYETCL